MPEPAHAPAPPAPAVSVAEQIAAVPDAQVEAVLSLQRTAGNRATRRAIGRAPDDRTEEIDRHAADVGNGLSQQTADAHNTAFRILAGLDMKLLLDVLARMRQLGTLHTVEEELAASDLDEGAKNRVQSALDALRGRAGMGEGDVDALPAGERDTVGEFGPAKPGTSGDDPEGNTYVVYDGQVKTYFMTKVEPKRRSSVWLANNPGNSDQLGGMGYGTSMKWGSHKFAIFPTMTAGRAALWAKIKEKPTLQAYLNYHLGQQTDGTFPEGNDPNTYLKHIQDKAPFVQFSTPPKEIEERGAVEDLLNGFMNAEGIVEGNTLTGSATVSAGMTPAQQKTMTFYLKLLGIRAK
ncbi:hypothetical protein [Solirubrobacter soli]|uniref:hypothetical protein n=1 Tax=Solirubrobacter soli TaxID=363832 RepID=UPI000403EA0D|nr:hypothetical protein [Solirubrobacter soli]